MGAAVALIPWQFFDANGDPLAAGRVYHYVAGGTTTAPVYYNNNLSSAVAQPLVLDSSGFRPAIYTPATPVISWHVTDANGVQVGNDINNLPNYTPAV